jgi:hypothetical protein
VGGGSGITGWPIQDKYWRELEKRYETKKREARKRSKRAVQIVEELANQEWALSEAIEKLHIELAVARVKSAEVYVELLKLKLELAEQDEDDDDFLLLH